MCESKRNAEFFKINSRLSLRSSYEILDPHPCTIIRVRAMIGLLKNHCQSAYHVEGKFETHFYQFVDIGAGR